MTKEQREYVADHLCNLIVYDEEHDEPGSDLPAFRAALDLLTDEAELHRRVGAVAVRLLDADALDADVRIPAETKSAIAAALRGGA